MGIFGKKQSDKSTASDNTADVLESHVEEKNTEEAPKKTTVKPKKETKKTEKVEKSMKDLYDNSDQKKDKAVDSKEYKAKTGNAYAVLVRPLVTEKITDLGAKNKYGFEVNLKTNKIEVAKAIEQIYGIKPTDVNIIKMEGKRVSRGRLVGKRKDWKKAIITLPKGKTIQVYEGV